jgi:hypothetical protein
MNIEYRKLKGTEVAKLTFLGGNSFGIRQWLIVMHDRIAVSGQEDQRGLVATLGNQELFPF